MAKNVVHLLEGLPSAQHGYFTRAQAAVAGVEDFDLSRALVRGFIDRVGHGVYRVAGAAQDRLAALRVAWLRLAPARGPRQRTLRPDIWVSHQSAAAVHGLGVFTADTPTFIVTDRLQPGSGVKVRRRRKGLTRDEWTVRDGFAVTTVERTAADLHAAGVDGGHLGRFINDALGSGVTDGGSLRASMEIGADELDALVKMNAGPGPER